MWTVEKHWIPHRLLRGLAVIGLTAGLAACGSLVELPNSGPAPALYNLTAATSVQSYSGSGGDVPVVLVEDPTAQSGINQRLIARRPSPTELQYFSGARWTARPTVMIQNALAETIEAAGLMSSRAQGGSPIPADYEVQVELRDFQAEYFGGTQVPEVHVRLAVTLVRLGPPQVLGQKIVDVRRGSAGGTLPAVIEAFNGATQDALAEAVNWALPKID